MPNYEIRTEFIEANGLMFEVDICGDGEKFAMCLHGFPEASHSWRAQMPMLAQQGYTVWAPNLRGYGNSSRPGKRSDYKMDLLTEDVAQLIDAAGAESTLLIAHDWGGAIAWDFAIRKKRPLEQLIVMNMPHPLKFFQSMGTSLQIFRSWYMMFFHIPWLPEFLLKLGKARAIGEVFRGMAIDKSRFPYEVLKVYRENALKPGALTAMINYYRANIPGGDVKEKLEAYSQKVETPTLMLWGEEDIALGKNLTYGTEKLVKDFTIKYIPDVSHWVQQEAPETVNALMSAWLQGKELPMVGAGGKLV